MTMEPPPLPPSEPRQSPEGAEQSPPQMRVLTQYVKELSFKNAAETGFARAYDIQPVIDMGVEVKSRLMGDSGDIFEVDLRISVRAKREEDPLFDIDVVYSGIFQFLSVGADDVEPMLWIECPRLLFPFSRQILAEVTREGGYPPLLINPIDFTPLYIAELRDRESRASETEFGDRPLSDVSSSEHQTAEAQSRRAFSSNAEAG